jgi:Flp pilus assembly pilin Flp
MSAMRLHSERGAELIEFALVLPLLLLLVLGIVDFGFMFQRMEVVTNAAREGARLAVLPGYDLETDVKSRVCDYLYTGGVPLTGTCPTPSNPTISVTSCDIPVAAGTVAGKKVIVTYSHNYVFMGPIVALFGGDFGAVPVRGVAIMRDESGAAGAATPAPCT